MKTKTNKHKLDTKTIKTKNKIDPMFDGHLEKPMSKMTPREKIYYLWLQMEFMHKIKNRKVIKKPSVKSSDGS
jgi:hypothetical protein